jgi:hypothetical protein
VLEQGRCAARALSVSRFAVVPHASVTFCESSTGVDGTAALAQPELFRSGVCPSRDCDLV